MPPTKPPKAPPAVRNLRAAALVVAALGLTQAVLGGTVLSGGGSDIRGIHGFVGYLTFVIALITIFFAYKASQVTDHKGTLYHAISLPVLALIQIGLAEMDVKWAHITVGILFLIAALGLYAMSDRPVDAAK